MTLLAPVWLIAGIAGALGVLALHFIARQRPAPMTLPTARFVPDMPERAASRAPRPTDVLLLLMRAFAVLLLGLAFAGPLLGPQRVPLARVAMLDRSSAVATPDSARAAALMLLRPGDVLVPFDTAAAAVHWVEGDSITGPTAAPADFGAALLVAMHEARALSPGADSIELVLISPIDASSWSAAVLPIRHEWPGRIRVIRTPGAAVRSTGGAIALRAEAGDPLAATVALLGDTGQAGGGPVRVVRDAPTAADSLWARDSGGALVQWPREAVATGSSALLSSGSGAVVARDVVAVAPWQRRAVAQGRAIAWWADGSPAAVETPLGNGCVRSVAVGVPEAGDVALARSTQRLVRALTASCGAPAPAGPVSDSIVRQVAGTGPLVAGTRLLRAGTTESAATPWLLSAGLALLLLEWLARRRMVRP
ncbi:MAG TPA: BatA domain-containing protein [Gemmatimonadaceae bacterium]|nr:BatA domain-containing protein [Gemmatimonadaceae bacterium]